MIIILCIDDEGGMLFNNRRQSRDRSVIDKTLEISKGSKLWMNRYSYSLFEDVQGNKINVDEAFLNEAANGEYCFVENCALAPYMPYIERLIVFRWNRLYPSDVKLDIDLAEWNLISSVDFAGKSHEKITMEVYER